MKPVLGASRQDRNHAQKQSAEHLAQNFLLVAVVVILSQGGCVARHHDSSSDSGSQLTGTSHKNESNDAGSDDRNALQPFSQEIPSAAFAFDMIPVGGDQTLGIQPFWIGRTELTWEAFDVFIYSLDQAGAPPGADATTRPSKPYLPPDRGFGHEGFPAIGMSHKNAAAFCDWLSAKTGRRYRLPTVAEWQHACRGGLQNFCSTGDLFTDRTKYIWFADNSEGVPHLAASNLPNPIGLHNMAGNVAEWCVAENGEPLVCGGSFRDSADNFGCNAVAHPQPAWNASDPQIPKSKWWLADAPFVGFRVVCDPDAIEEDAQEKDQ